MTLASQRVRVRSGRSSRSSRFRRRRKQHRGRLVGGIVLVVIVLGGGYWVVTRIGGGPAPASAGEPEEVAPEPSSSLGDPASASSSRQLPPAREIVMGGDRNTTRNAPADAGASAVPGSADDRAGFTQPADPVQPPGQPKPEPAPPPSQPPPAAVAPAEKPAQDQSPHRPAGVVETFLQRGRQDQQAGKLVEARQVLNAALFHREATDAQKAVARALMTEINQTLVFSPTVYEGDPLTEKYRVQKNDALSTIVPARGLAVHFHFLARINGLKNPNALQLNQPLKLVRGPFHAIVDKSEYRIDLYAGDPPSPGSAGNSDGVEEGWMYIRSFNVGLGEGNGTPLGNFIIKNKEYNPSWRNPRNGDFYDRNDPKNPIGEHWLGLQGVGESAQHTGYGLHGTIEPDSIGRDMSMGCVRMAADDIATVWEMLTENVSTVRIRP